MHARQGDQIVIDTTTLDALRRHGEVIEMIGQGEREHYRIRCRTATSRCTSRARTPAWCRRAERAFGATSRRHPREPKKASPAEQGRALSEREPCPTSRSF